GGLELMWGGGWDESVLREVGAPCPAPGPDLPACGHRAARPLALFRTATGEPRALATVIRGLRRRGLRLLVKFNLPCRCGRLGSCAMALRAHHRCGGALAA